MRTMSLLQKWSQRNAVIGPAAIGREASVHSLVRVVSTLLSGGKLALTVDVGSCHNRPVVGPVLVPRRPGERHQLPIPPRNGGP